MANDLISILPSDHKHPHKVVYEFLYACICVCFRVFHTTLKEEIVKSESGVVRFRLWQPNHSEGDQWAVDNLIVTPDVQSSSLQADFAVSMIYCVCVIIFFKGLPKTTIYRIISFLFTFMTIIFFCVCMFKITIMNIYAFFFFTSQPNSLIASPWLSVTGSSSQMYCGSLYEAQVMDGTEPVREAVTKPLTLTQGDIISFQV